MMNKKIFYGKTVALAGCGSCCSHKCSRFCCIVCSQRYPDNRRAVFVGGLCSLVDGELRYLLIRSPNGDVGFPKGHIEFGETEEVAALREIYEETSVKAELVDGFQEMLTYTIPNGKMKTVVYFVGKYENQIPKHNEGFEDNQYMILGYEEALKALAFDNAKEVLKKVNLFLKNDRD